MYVSIFYGTQICPSIKKIKQFKNLTYITKNRKNDVFK